MTNYEEQLQAHLDAQADAAAHAEQLKHCYQMGLQCESYCDIMRAKGDDHLIHGFIDHFIDYAEIDWFQADQEHEFEMGCPTARKYWEEMRKIREAGG